jgi:translin
MQNFDSITERIRQGLDARTSARDKALAQARLLTRQSSLAIRAIHRSEKETAHEHLAEGRQIADQLRTSLADYPELYYAGYTQDALKEFTEATLTCAVIEEEPIPSPEDLHMEYAAYLNGLAEVTGELRRRCLDILRQGYSRETERLLACMDEIYNLLVTLDYPDAITNGLRRQTDLVRGIVERTRGDLTISLREQHLEKALAEFSGRLNEQK